MKKAKVYFSTDISAAGLVRIFNAVNKDLTGKVAVKTHSGEPGGTNYLKPELMKELVQKVQGTIVECNTAYRGKRFETQDHLQTLRDHGFTEIASVDVMDSEGDLALPVENGKHLQENYVGANLANYDSILMLSHFKGHQMGGFGGALKNMSIGIASRNGKAHLHSAGATKDPDESWQLETKQDDFLEAMAEGCQAVMKYIADKGGEIVYLNVMNNLSVDCDCNASPEKPCMKDIGVLASFDPVALDRACLDLIYQSKDEGRDHFLERVQSRNGEHIIDYAVEMGIGTKEYELIEIESL